MPDTQSNFRMLHTMIRVMDLDKSLAFYTGPMGMKLLPIEQSGHTGSPWRRGVGRRGPPRLNRES